MSAASAAASSSSAAPVDPARLPSALAARGIQHSDKARWKTIYPIYINSQKKVSEGRKLPVKLCVEKPSVYDIADMCVFLKLPYIIEVRCNGGTEQRPSNESRAVRRLRAHALTLPLLCFRLAPQDKCYSRDFWERGRVRVQLKDDAGVPLLSSYPDRRTLLRFMASKIPALKTRAQRLANAPPEEKPMVPEMDREEKAQAKIDKKADKKAAKKKAKK